MRPSRAACGGDRCRFFRPPRECGSRNASSPRASRDGCRRASRSRKYRHRFSSGPRRRIPIRRAASRTLHGTPPFSPPPFAGTAAPPARRANRVPRRTPQPPNPASAAVSPPYRAASRQRTGCRPRHEPLRGRTPTPRGVANRAANRSASARHAANEDTRKVAAARRTASRIGKRQTACRAARRTLHVAKKGASVVGRSLRIIAGRRIRHHWSPIRVFS